MSASGIHRLAIERKLSMRNTPFVRLVLAGLVMAFGLQLSVSASTWIPLTITQLTLVDPIANQDIRTLGTDETIDLSQVGSRLTIRAEVTGKVGSVAFLLDGKTSSVENDAPYRMRGDADGALKRWAPATGTYTLRVIPYPSRNRGGKAGEATEVTLRVISSATASTPPADEAPVATEPEDAPAIAPGTRAVTKLVLVDANSNQDLGELENGDTIALSDVGDQLSIRAEVAGKVGSVHFIVNGKSGTIENTVPYAILGDDSGRYKPWTPEVGSYKIRVTPYLSRNRGGSVGVPKEVTFNIVADAESHETGDNTPPGTTPVPIPVPPLAVVPKLYKANGQLDLSLYGLLALSYDKAAMEMRLGPSFRDLSPNAVDDRPMLFRPVSHKRINGYARTNPYELGTSPKTDSDYWSESGQVGYVPDDASNPGLDRIQVYAYYDKVFALSPRLDWASGRPRPDLQTTEPDYIRLFGEKPSQPIAMVRNYGMQCNEALVLYRDGYLAVAGTQTSRNGSERPYPGFVFPAHKVPTNLTITTANEFALVTVWDTHTKKGEVAVFALEGKWLPFHTWPYMAMPNQGSWSAFKLLGYVELPMAMPTSIASASNGWWSGPSQTGGKVLSEINLKKDSDRKNVYNGAWKAVVAEGGYAIVASKYDNRVAILDLTAMFSYVRESYLSSAASYQQTLAARGTKDSDFPQAFSVRPSIKPTVVWQSEVTTPTAVLAGQKIDRWTKDYFKAYVASQDGTIRIIDTTPLMNRFPWEKLGSLRVVGSFNVGRNPVSMAFTRRSDSNLPLLPVNAAGEQARPDPLNNLFYVAVRGDRKLVAAVTYQGQGEVYRTITDKRMEDPVAVSTAIRGPIVSVADFAGKKMISFRVGTIHDKRNNVIYRPGENGEDGFEYAGDVPMPGHPFLINTTNVN